MRIVVLLLVIGAAAFAQDETPKPPEADLPYLIFPGGRLVATESAVAENISDKKFTKYAVAGATSGSRTPLALPEFAFLSDEIDPASLQLYGFESVNGRREITLAKKDKPLAKPYFITPYADEDTEGLFKIRVSSGLPVGEHCLTPRTSDQVFCFTVY